MGRGKGERRSGPALRPVERVEVSGKHMGLRLAAFALCLAVALGALGYWLYSLLSTEPGWTQVEAASGEAHCGEDFNFQYLAGQGGASASAELRRLRNVYSGLARKAYQLFTPAEGFEDMHNLCYVNQHPNEDVEVDPALYQAFSQISAYGSRAVYLGPVYNLYDDLFFSQDEYSAWEFDPYANPEAASFYKELAGFAADPAQVDLKLLGENTLRLEVSPEYQRYAEDIGRTQYLDFGWMRNAFIADYFARELNSQGFTQGTISSSDGFVRSLGDGLGAQVFSLYDWDGEQAVLAVQAQFAGTVNLANLRAFPLDQRDEERMYVGGGQVRHPYIDPADGLCKAAANALALYAPGLDCAELALRGEKLFVAEKLDQAALLALSREGVETIAPLGQAVLYSQEGLVLENFYKSNGLEYYAQPLGGQATTEPASAESGN